MIILAFDMVLDKLSESLKNTLQKIAKAVFVDEKLVNELVKDIQRALLQADVNVQLVFDLTSKIKDRVKNENTPAGLTKKEHLINIVYDELVNFLGKEQYKVEKAEVYFGAFLTNVVSFFIIISTASTLYKAGIHIESASDAALALAPLVGGFAEFLFAFGLFVASMLGAFILPVATAYAICEAFGWEAGFDTNWNNGRFFYSIILLSIIVPAALVLLPGISLVKVMVLSQDVNGILLPFILIFVMKIVNSKEIMGEYVNKRLGNIIAWATIVGIIAATIVLVLSSFARL